MAAGCLTVSVRVPVCRWVVLGMLGIEDVPHIHSHEKEKENGLGLLPAHERNREQLTGMRILRQFKNLSAALVPWKNCLFS